jgi:hypothetical protein
VFVTFTDGLENASQEYTRTQIFELIRKQQEIGWSFVSSRREPDAYAESERLGYASGSVQNFAADARGENPQLASRSASGPPVRLLVTGVGSMASPPRSLLRGHNGPDRRRPMRFEFLDFALDPDRGELLHAGEPVDLEPKVMAFLALLLERRASS